MHNTVPMVEKMLRKLFWRPYAYGWNLSKFIALWFCAYLYVLLTLRSVVFVLSRISQGSDRTGSWYQCLFVWLGRFSASKSGSKEEGDWLVQKVPGHINHTTRYRFTAHQKIRHYRYFFSYNIKYRLKWVAVIHLSDLDHKQEFR